MYCLMSIKPKFAEKIYSKEKLFEYRRSGAKEKISRIYIYETAPVGKVTGYADTDYLLESTPESLWNHTKEWSGISEEDFFAYFKGKKTGIAYHLENAVKFPSPKELGLFGISRPPQSFLYLKEEKENLLKKTEETFFN